MTEKETPSVSENIIDIFNGNNTTAKVAFLESCPDSPAMATAKQSVSQPYLEVNLAGLSMLAETYSRGIDCNLGVALSEAIYRLAQEALPTTSCEEKLYGAYLFCAGNSLNSWLLGLNALGQYHDSVQVVERELEWLKDKSYDESQEHQCMLLLSLIEAYIGLAHGNDGKENKLLAKVKTLLDTTNWGSLKGAYEIKLNQLQQKYARLVQDATNLPTSPDKKQELEQKESKQFNEEINENLRIFDKSLENIRKFEEKNKIAPKISTGFKNIIESLKPLRQKLSQESPSSDSTGEQAITDRDANKQESSPSSISAGEQAIANKDITDQLTDFLSALNPNQTQRLQLQKQIRNACLIFADPVKGQDQKLIQNSQNKLQEARSFARQNNFIEDENDALWGLYLCYSRSQQEDRAIDALQSLRQNLESLRSQISDPMKCAGVFQKFPYLFASLCQLLCRAGRSEELLNAMEGAKGRVLADVLTESQGEVIEDSTFTETVKYLPELMRQVHAHYLSYFVDDESTYAVLVAKDGSIHSHEIALSKKELREWSKDIDPKPWGTTTYSGDKRIDIPDDLPDRLAELVSWLEPFAKSGLIKCEDHICYCPDEELHLVPLHYVTFLNEPLVKYVSLSRIHGASALISILRKSPEYYTQAVAIQVPYEHEKRKSKEGERFYSKLQQLDRVPNWLSKNLSTDTLKDEKADLQALRNLNLRNKLIHFSTHGIFPQKAKSFFGKEQNPYINSGLMLAFEGKLPVRNVKDLKNSDVYKKQLLTPKKILDQDTNPNLNFSESHISIMACVSGLSKEGIGGDALGLEWAFLLAGSNSLLSTHWNVPATAAAEFSLRFYDKWLNQHFPRYAAWRETVLELMSYQWLSDEHCSTYYWAAFSLSGDWR